MSLPPSARWRVEVPGGPWLATASPTELTTWAAGALGPVGVVRGTSVVHAGLEASSWPNSAEIPDLSDVGRRSRVRALERLRAEAAALGADGVVGVSLTVHAPDWGHELLEVTATGDAVRSTDGSWPAGAGGPWTTRCSGADLAALAHRGWVPVAVVVGCCTHHVEHRALRRSWITDWRTDEVPSLTVAATDGPEVALARLAAAATAIGAGGVSGVTVEGHSYGWGDRATEWVATGDAAVARSSTGPAGS